MARIKFGMMMTDARGKLGGQVFTKTRSGATIRTKVTPTNPQTFAQQKARSILGNLSSQWRSLTADQRARWNSSVEGYQKTNIFGDTYNPSGKNLFVGLNSNLNQINIATQTEAPVPVEVPAILLESVTVQISDNSITLVNSNALPGVGFTIVVQATKPSSAGRYNFSGQYATVATGSGFAMPDENDLYADYIGKYGSPVAGSKISFKLFVIVNSTGQKSVESTIDTIVLA